MTEYIERATTIKALKDNVTEMEGYIYFYSNKGVPEDDIEDIVNEIPAADVVEVVRCKDCKYCDPSNNHCDHPNSTSLPVPRKDSDFCSYGKRKNDSKKC